MNRTASLLAGIYNGLLAMLKDPDGRGMPGHSLMNGKWGALFFLFYYERYCAPELDEAGSFLEELYELLDSGQPADFSYCNGLSGPFWLLCHLHKYGFAELDVPDLAYDFITAAIVESDRLLAARNVDLLHGSGGICNLLAEFADRQDVREHLMRFVRTIESLGHATDQGLSLPVFESNEGTLAEIEGSVNAFSMAHGSPPLLIILVKIARQGIAPDVCKALIYESIRFMLHQRNHFDVHDPANVRLSFYPSILDGRYSFGRLSWCYGDLNVATVLWYCGDYFGESGWKEEAVAIMRFNALKKTMKEAGVDDAGLCHGTGGIASMYYRFWAFTGEPLFGECAEAWYRQAEAFIAFPAAEKEYGVKVWKGPERQWEYCWDLLDGSAGTGLALISHLMEQALPWDECLLLS